MKQLTAILCGFLAVPSISSAQVVDEFFCGGENGGKPMKMWIEGGHLYAYNNKQLDYGPVNITATTYRSRLAQPLMTDGSGSAVLTWTIDRQTGRFEFEMNAHRPGAPKPFHSLLEGVCTGVDADGASSHSSPSTTPSKSSSIDTLSNQTDTNTFTDQYETQSTTQQTDHQQNDLRQQQEKERALATEKLKLEQQRKQEEARLARARAEVDRKKKEEDAKIAKEKADRLAKEKAEQERRNNENGIRTSFSGWATTCAGGGKDVLYLQTSRPPTTGCTVNFQARCPNTSASVDFTQRNYIGGSCMGLGDNIRIGTMPCEAKQVQIAVTSASCGL